MRHYLKLSSFLFLLFAACTSPYKHLEKQDHVAHSALQYKPVFDRELYRCVVDGKFLFKKFHLSGVLFFKTLDAQTTHVAFQNEMGFAFFDFEWKNDSFKVAQIIPQLNKQPVIKILRKDIELLLMNGLDAQTEQVYKKGQTQYHRFTLNKGYVYYIEKAARLMSIENTGTRKKVTAITMGDKPTMQAMPETMFFKHYKANFTIQLNKIGAHADE